MKKRLYNILLILLTGGLLAVLVLKEGDKDLLVLKQKYAGAPSAFLQMSGLDVHYREEGPASDSIPIVLLHGTGASLHTYDVWTDILKKTNRVIRMDIPGFGLTGPFTNRDYHIKNYVEFIHEFLDSLGVNKCILAGNSLGGQIAWNYTIKYPQDVQKLILIDAAGLEYNENQPPLAFKIARIPILKNIMTFITPKSLVKKSLQDVYYDKSKVTSQLTDRYFDLTLRSGNRQAMIDRLNTPIDYTAVETIKTIQQPTLVLWGENDYLIPLSCTKIFSALLPKDTLVVIPKCGHVPMEELPFESVKILQKFIRG
ncbi:MAG: alpha/beta hydrolase [Saprospiraceae bacterium]|nr:alpha/beta hydrolase [Saprospiraceae bacterium]